MSRQSEFDSDRRRSLFGANAELYGDGRPGYPSEVFDFLAHSCGLGPGCKVLEVGPGAGQATGDLLDAGADVVAVELGENFKRLLSDKYGDRSLQIVLGDFATVELPIESVDLVVAATSFHWIEPTTGLRRVAELLRPGGSLALWWTHYGDSDRLDPFRQALQPILHRHVPQFADTADGGAAIGAHPYALDLVGRTQEIDGVGQFGPVEQKVVAWLGRHTAAQVRGFFASFSQWMALEEPTKTDLLNDIEQLVSVEFGGVVERPYLTALYIAKRN